LRPPTIASTAPVRGSSVTSAAVGPISGGSAFAIASLAIFCIRRSIVVRIRRPPPKTCRVWNFWTSWSVT
jgi:hypothetical protein